MRLFSKEINKMARKNGGKVSKPMSKILGSKATEKGTRIKFVNGIGARSAERFALSPLLQLKKSIEESIAPIIKLPLAIEVSHEEVADEVTGGPRIKVTFKITDVEENLVVLQESNRTSLLNMSKMVADMTDTIKMKLMAGGMAAIVQVIRFDKKTEPVENIDYGL